MVVLDDALVVRYANPAAENLLTAGAKSLIGQPFLPLFAEPEALRATLDEARGSHWDYSGRNVSYLRPSGEPLQLACVVARVDQGEARLLAELRPIEQQLRLEREERLVSEQQSNRELIRNLAHEIKNPLGGLRGSAQLLERELQNPELREYTQVIIKEADRLQALMDRLLAPHRTPHVGPVNVHEVLEHVRSLLLAEFADVRIERDYDPSVPDLAGDREQLIQALLNIGRNAAQALAAAGGRQEPGVITLRSRAARNITLLRHRHRLALDLQVIDNGLGVPEEIRDRIFHPLVSGREGGTGLGLSIAQTYIQYHQGVIECDSRPGRTVFRIWLPMS